jgi:transcriptional regulator with XRE-family HTH domain
VASQEEWVEDDGEGVSSRLRRLRLSAGLSQSHLAGKAGLRRTTVQAIEAGTTRHPLPSTIARLARALGVRPGDLFGQEPWVSSGPETDTETCGELNIAPEPVEIRLRVERPGPRGWVCDLSVPPQEVFGGITYLCGSCGEVLARELWLTHRLPARIRCHACGAVCAFDWEASGP